MEVVTVVEKKIARPQHLEKRKNQKLAPRWPRSQ